MRRHRQRSRRRPERAQVCDWTEAIPRRPLPGLLSLAPVAPGWGFSFARRRSDFRCLQLVVERGPITAVFYCEYPLDLEAITIAYARGSLGKDKNATATSGTA